MGILGLWLWIKERAGITDNKCMHDISQFRGCTLGVDVSVWLNEAIHSRELKPTIAIDLAAKPPVSISSHIRCVFDQRLAFCKSFGITLLLTFDCARNPLKKDKNEERVLSSQTAKEDFEKYIISNEPFDENHLKLLLKNSVFPCNEMYLVMYEWANENKVMIYGAPIEADFALAWLCIIKKIDGVITTDGDILLLGATNVITNINYKSFALNPVPPGASTVKNCTIWTQQNITNVINEFTIIGKSKASIILDTYALSIFLGCDFAPRPHGFGKEFLKTNFQLWINADMNGKNDILNLIENSGLWPGMSKSKSRIAIPNYAATFKAALWQFTSPVVFRKDRITNNMGLFTCQRIAADTVNSYLGYLTPAYDASQEVMKHCNPGTTYDNIFTMKIWARTGKPLDIYRIPNPQDVDGVILPFGSVKDFLLWPPERRPTSDLVEWLLFRGIRWRESDIKRAEILKAVNHLLTNEHSYRVLPNINIIGAGKYIAIETLIPLGTVQWLTDQTAVVSFVRNKLPEINDLVIDEIFGPRPGVRARAKNWVTSGQFDISKLKVAEVQFSDGQLVYAITIQCVPSCASDYYDALIFVSNHGRFLGAPCSRCRCKAGNFFCAHMLGLLLILSIIQYDNLSTLGEIVSYMPMPIKSFQSLPIPLAYLYNSRSTDESLKDIGNKLSKLTSTTRIRSHISAYSDSDDNDTEELNFISALNGSMQDALEAENEDLADVFAIINPETQVRRIVAEINQYVDGLKEIIDGHPTIKTRQITEQTIRNYVEHLKNDTGPNASTADMLEQLEMHQDMHMAYQTGELDHCMMAYYLNFFETSRLEMIDAIKDNGLVFFGIGTRLAKFPPGWIILADRGFAYDSGKYPCLNPIITPHFINKRKQFTQEEMEADLGCCKARYISEVNFANKTHFTSLQDVIPWDYFSILQHIVDLSTGAANLYQPLNPPANYYN